MKIQQHCDDSANQRTMNDLRPAARTLRQKPRKHEHNHAISLGPSALSRSFRFERIIDTAHCRCGEMADTNRNSGHINPSTCIPLCFRLVVHGLCRFPSRRQSSRSSFGRSFEERKEVGGLFLGHECVRVQDHYQGHDALWTTFHRYRPPVCAFLCSPRATVAGGETVRHQKSLWLG